MELDDLEPLKKVPQRKNLDPMSVDELSVYIGELEAEIARVRAAIKGKQSVRAGAESLFRK